MNREEKRWGGYFYTEGIFNDFTEKYSVEECILNMQLNDPQRVLNNEILKDKFLKSAFASF